VVSARSENQENDILASLSFKPVRHFTKEGAERGDPDSHFNLGALHSAGLGVKQDPEKAVACYEAASAAGHWKAPHVLAVAHQTGSGTPRNCTRAAQLLRVFVEERLGWTRAGPGTRPHLSLYNLSTLL
jgi:TPR repeat protein